MTLNEAAFKAKNRNLGILSRKEFDTGTEVDEVIGRAGGTGFRLGSRKPAPELLTSSTHCHAC